MKSVRRRRAISVLALGILANASACASSRPDGTVDGGDHATDGSTLATDGGDALGPDADRFADARGASVDGEDGAPDAPDGGCVDPNGRPLAPGGGYYNGCVIEQCVAGGDFVGEAVPCSDAGASEADGAPGGCATDADCGGLWCVFTTPGCGARGTCLTPFAAPSSDCTRDSVAYCGCDGATFMDSSSCPRRAYFQWGVCGRTT